MSSDDINLPKMEETDPNKTKVTDELESQGVDFKTEPSADIDNNNIFNQGGKDYRTLGRKDMILIMYTNQFGLGILSLPSALRTLGLVPGIIAIFGIGCMTWYTAYELLQYYRRHPQVVNIQVIFFAASSVVTISIALNSISAHATCTIVFIFVACFGCYLLSMPRSMKFLSYTGIPNAVSVFAATMVAIVAIAVKGPAVAPPNWTKEIAVVGNPDFRDGSNACLRIAYAYAGNVVFPGYMAEMREPSKDFGFCLATLEIGSMIFFSLTAAILYGLAGQYTSSPILGAAPVISAKVAYGLILPAVFATGLTYGHTGPKYVYVGLMRKMGAIHQITDNSLKSWGTWIGCVSVFWVIVFILANVIPVFDSILSISSATTIAWFSYEFSALFWFHLNWNRLQGWRKISLAIVNALLILVSLFMNGAGLWAAITELLDIFQTEGSSVRGVFSCGNNALF
ncbi:hypothetical protein CEP54_013813 [Fusarium duplospermum]|uniref:Amino acid transporter transmembrane domain-containing protein n=1 Tax=Fusarium duplospermum TaxID=1325734 RepID=A0A428P0A4_9HYPO|nr:hypothetical protein CEP54_013813 [Fusarium duplospermum]